jgi:HD-GYP domain-containing protein (c-di-GMP phosphodiesterase class II)
MTSNRPYGRAMTVDEALEELSRNASLQFDPEVVEALSEVITCDRVSESRRAAAGAPGAPAPAKADA